MTLAQDLDAADLKQTSFYMKNIKLTLKSSKSEGVLAGKDLSFTGSYDDITFSESIDWEIDCDRLTMSVTNLEKFSSVVVKDQLTISISNDVKLDLSEKQLVLNSNKNISIIGESSSVALIQDSSTSRAITLSSDVATAPGLIIFIPSTITFIGDFPSPLTIDAKSYDITMTAVEGTLNWPITARTISIPVSGKTDFTGEFYVTSLLLSTAETILTKVSFTNFTGGIDMKSSVLSVTMNNLTQSSNYNSYLNIIYTVGKSRVSTLNAKEFHSDISSLSAVRIRVEFDTTPSDSEIQGLLDNQYDIFSTPSFDKTGALTIQFTSDSPKNLIGFSTDSNCMSIIVDTTNGYKQKLKTISPTSLQYVLKVSSSDFPISFDSIPDNFKNIKIEVDPDFSGLSNTIDFSSLNTTNIPATIEIGIDTSSFGTATLGITAESTQIASITLSGITLSTSNLNVQDIKLKNCKLSTGATVNFNQAKVSIDSSIDSFLTSSFKDLTYDYGKSVSNLVFASDKWKLDGKELLYSNIEKLTIITSTSQFSSPKITVDTGVTSITPLTWIVTGNLVLESAGTWTGVTISSPIIISHDTYTVEYTVNSPAAQSAVSFEGTGIVTINQNYAAGSDIYACYSADDCTGHSDSILFTNLNAKLLENVGTKFNVFIGPTTSGHPVIGTNSIKTSIITFKPLTGTEKVKIEFDNDNNLDVGTGTTTTFENIELTKKSSSSSIKFGATVFVDSSIKITNMEATDVTIPFDTLAASSMTALTCATINLNGNLPTVAKTLDLNNAKIQMEVPSTNLLLGDNSITIANNLNLKSTSKFVVNIATSTTEITFDAPATSITIPIIDFTPVESLALNFKGNFANSQVGYINIINDVSCTYNLYGSNIPITTTNSIMPTFKVFASEVSISKLIQIKRDYSKTKSVITSEDSLDSAKISFLGGIKIINWYSSDNGIFDLMNSNLVIDIASISADSDSSTQIKFTYYLDLNGIGCVNILAANTFPVASTFNILTNVPAPLDETNLSFFDETHVILTTASELASFSTTISASAADSSVQQAHGFTKATFAFGLRAKGTKVEMYTKTDPRNIPVTMYYGLSCQADKYDVCLKEADLSDVAKYKPTWINAVSISLEKQCTINLNYALFENSWVELIWSSFYGYLVQISLGTIKHLRLDSVQYSITSQTGEIQELELYNSYPKETTSTNIDFTKVNELNVSMTRFSSLNLASYENPITFFSSDSGGMTFKSNGWTIQGIDIVSANFPNASIEFNTNSVPISLGDGVTSIIPADIRCISDTVSFSISSGWDKISEESKIVLQQGTTVSAISTQSFTYPFIIPSDVIPNLNIDSSNVTITDPINVHNWKLNVAMPQFNTFGLFYALITKNMIMSGANTITVTNKKNGGIIADDIVLNSQSDSTIGNLFVNKVLNAKSGSKLHGTLNAASMELHWADDKFPFIEMATDSTQVPTEIKIIFDGTDSDEYESLVYGKTFNIISSNKCEELKEKSVFESSVDSFNGANSVLDVQCDGINLQVKGARKISQEVAGSSNQHDIDVQQSSLEQEGEKQTSQDIKDNDNSSTMGDYGENPKVSSLIDNNPNIDQQSSLIDNNHDVDKQSSITDNNDQNQQDSSNQDNNPNVNEQSSIKNNDKEEPTSVKHDLDEHTTAVNDEKRTSETSEIIQSDGKPTQKPSINPDDGQSGATSPQSKNNTGMIVGVVIGVIAAVVIIIVVTVVCMKKKKDNYGLSSSDSGRLQTLR